MKIIIRLLEKIGCSYIAIFLNIIKVSDLLDATASSFFSAVAAGAGRFGFTAAAAASLAAFVFATALSYSFLALSALSL